MFKKLLLVTAMPFMTLAPLAANAGVLGIADLNISSFALIVANSDPKAPVVLVRPDQIAIVGDIRTGTANADFNGVPAVPNGSGNITRSGGADVDVKYRCAGPDCGTISSIYTPQIENNVSTHLTAATKNFALGDMFISGQAIGASGNGANGLTRADSSIANASNAGGSNSTIQNTAFAKTTFKTLGSDLSVQFALTYDVFINAFIDAANPANEQSLASGSTSFTLTVTENIPATSTTPAKSTQILSYTPSELNNGLGANSAQTSMFYQSNGTIFTQARTLKADTQYTLVINQTANSTASEIPEPGSIALLGLGLLAIGASVSRRRKG